MYKVQITNTLSGKKELVATYKEAELSLYVCGITPYDFAHVGHGRVYITFDLLVRLFSAIGYKVHYCRNFTDIDDKLLARAERELGDRLRYKEIAKTYIDAFSEDVRLLGCITPEFEPRVTETIDEIISFIKGLIANNFAYVSNGSVYFSVTSFHDYGKLSKRTLDELIAGARVEINEEKRDPMDFALWKREMGRGFWESPWGHGRPGWHIECSVMAYKHLGAHVDIHGGGMDLIFPHHENEIAQSEGYLGHQAIRYWMHNAFVRIDKEKMSKSLGNFFTLRQLFEKYDPMVVRYMMLGHHYRSPLDFSFDDLEVAHKSYQRLVRTFVDVETKLAIDFSHPLVLRMVEFLSDDLNTPGAMGVVFENISLLSKNREDRVAVKSALVHLFGLAMIPLPEKNIEMTPEIELLLQEREAARAVKNWKRSDEIRDQLRDLGIEVRDKKG